MYHGKCCIILTLVSAQLIPAVLLFASRGLVSIKIVRHCTVCCLELIRIVRYPLRTNTIGVLVIDRNRHGDSVCVRNGRHSVYVRHGVRVCLTHRGRGRVDEERR
jgi:hypothetical protein